MDTALPTFGGKSWCLVEPTKQHKSTNAQQNQHSRPTHILLSTLWHLWFFDLFSSTYSVYSGKSLTPAHIRDKSFLQFYCCPPCWWHLRQRYCGPEWSSSVLLDKQRQALGNHVLLRGRPVTRTCWWGQERRRTTFLKWLTCTNVAAMCRFEWGPEGFKLCCPSPRSTGYN